MTESLEVQYARLDERLKSLLKMMEASASAQTEMSDSLANITFRVRNVEASLAKNAPTIDEFITIKHKVVGAGALGKWLWGVGALLIGWVFGAKDIIARIKELFS